MLGVGTVLLAAILAGCTGPRAAAPTILFLDPAKPLTRIAFGSCNRQNRPQPHWDKILATDPQLFLHLGDNIYADTTDPAVMRRKYDDLARDPGYRRLRARLPVMAIWDDHDYGRNDAGTTYPMKRAAKEIFLDFFGDPKGSARRRQEGGIHTAHIIGPPGRRVQLILLDTRYDRAPLHRVSKAERRARRGWKMGPYRPNPDPKARMLGDAQWRWLETQFRKPAELRIVATGTRFLAENTGFESWSNLPLERRRLIDLIAKTGARGVFLLSGDPHFAEISRQDDEGAPYPLYDITSSSLNSSNHRPHRNTRRILGPYGDPNFGLVEIDWAGGRVQIEIRDAAGDNTVLKQVISIDALQN